MVDITEFFGKDQSSKRSVGQRSVNKRVSARSSKHNSQQQVDVIKIDDDDADLDLASNLQHDEPLEMIEKPPQAMKTANTRISAPKKNPVEKTTGTNKGIKRQEEAEATSKSSGPKLSAEDVLASIPGVDLSEVHVKENVGFDFRAKPQENASADLESIDIPEGEPNCLLGLTIVFTGVLPSLERGAAEAVAKRYGARVTKSISSKTSVVVLGDEAGPKKIEKIKQLNIKAIDEDGFKALISGMPKEGGDGARAQRELKKLKDQEAQAKSDAAEMIRQDNERLEKLKSTAPENNSGNKRVLAAGDLLWTTKYAPSSLQQICGNKTSVTKLKNWLANWRNAQKNGFKVAGKDGSGVFRAAMLYGPPGIGKTTAAQLVARELGFDVLEQNASDVRSKSLLDATVKNALDNTSIVGLFKHKQDTNANGRKFVIIMDEVDGMSGGDRGGVGKMAQFCRTTSMPMILICNERNLPKMRPFDRTCLDIQFRRPDANSIKARLMTIAVREKFKLDPNVVDRLVQATRGDIRQMINLFSTISTTTKHIGHDNAQEIARAWEKNIALKPFDITHKLFDGRHYSEIGARQFPLYKKMELYFDDFDFTPLMVQENYLSTKPSVLGPEETHLQAVCEAADCISEGDLVERKIRSSEQLWSLLPFHAIMSAVRPSSMIAGHITGRINFTAWLGQNSKMGKYYRLLQELQYHTRLTTSTNKIGLRLEYMSTLKRRLLDPLVKQGSDGISGVIELMDDYYLSKEDWDSVMDFMIGSDKTDMIIKKIPTAVKSGFTRSYNASTHPVAIYRTGSTTSIGGKSKATPDFEDVVDADDELPPADEEPKEDTDFKKDKLIKQGRPKTAKKRAASATKKAPAKKRKA
ncbi:LAMI_0H06304g1_1 [Lachancea mirantina]|uniref:Replication factor C subunit 1 n=1 Tax=Lachancea mirantina TaxID=1230905 RepID=A0A1G4KF68_9SACH|nr:LAMI_0H06304g1_1 [Lachancea mirantina]